MPPKSLFWPKPSQMKQENQMAQETSLYAKEWVRRDEDPRPFLNEQGTVRAVSTRSTVPFSCPRSEPTKKLKDPHVEMKTSHLKLTRLNQEPGFR